MTPPGHYKADQIGCSSNSYDRRVVLDGDGRDLDDLLGAGNYAFGSTMLYIPESLIFDEVVDLYEDDISGIILAQETNNRGIEHWTGTFKVLIVRVTDKNGVSPNPTAAQLSTAVFSTSGTSMVGHTLWLFLINVYYGISDILFVIAFQ